MTPFEEQLKKALERQEPSEGFTERVLARVSGPRERGWTLPPWLLPVAAAATFLLAGGSAYQKYEQQQEQQVRGQAAKQKLLLALHIAGRKLQQTQDRLTQIESSEATQ